MFRDAAGEPTKFDQNTSTITADMTQNLPTGANYDLNYSPQRTFVGGRIVFCSILPIPAALPSR